MTTNRPSKAIAKRIEPKPDQTQDTSDALPVDIPELSREHGRFMHNFARVWQQFDAAVHEAEWNGQAMVPNTDDIPMMRDEDGMIAMRYAVLIGMLEHYERRVVDRGGALLSSRLDIHRDLIDLHARLRLSIVRGEEWDWDERAEHVTRIQKQLRAVDEVGEDGGEQAVPQVALNESDIAVMETLAKYNTHRIVTVGAVERAMPPKHRLSDKKIGRIVNKLRDHGLAERPEGPKDGARLTIKGRMMLPSLVGK